MDTVETRIVPAWSRVLYKQGEFLIYTTAYATTLAGHVCKAIKIIAVRYIMQGRFLIKHKINWQLLSFIESYDHFCHVAITDISLQMFRNYVNIL